VSGGAAVVEIRTAPLAVDGGALAAFRALLSPEEGARADAFAFEEPRRAFTVSRGRLRVLLASFAGGAPEGLRILEDDLGKPRLGGGCGQGRWRFNVSHSGGLWACAVALHREVGLDLEAVRPDRAVESITKRYFSPAEAAALTALPAAERTAAFHRIWTRKEAWLKARGFGITVPLDSFEVSLEAGDARLLATRPDPGEAARWTLRDLDFGGGFVGALCVEGAGPVEVRKQVDTIPDPIVPRRRR
jgi:4'-phosphopantetheinyl transferase